VPPHSSQMEIQDAAVPSHDQLPPNRVPRRTQDKRQTNRSCASEFSHSYEFNSTAHALNCYRGRYTGLWLWPV
jgi:hypothetical protein